MVPNAPFGSISIQKPLASEWQELGPKNKIKFRKKIVLANELCSVLPKIEKWKDYQAFHVGELG